MKERQHKINPAVHWKGLWEKFIAIDGQLRFEFESLQRCVPIASKGTPNTKRAQGRVTDPSLVISIPIGGFSNGVVGACFVVMETKVLLVWGLRLLLLVAEEWGHQLISISNGLLNYSEFTKWRDRRALVMNNSEACNNKWNSAACVTLKRFLINLSWSMLNAHIIE